MLRTTFVLLVLGLAAAVAGQWDAAVGKWALTATAANGDESQWTLQIKEEAGKLVGTLANPEGASIPIQQPVLKGNDFSFKVTVGEALYAVEAKIDGKKLTGKFTGSEMSGTLKAVKE
jgi:hypothetical protein